MSSKHKFDVLIQERSSRRKMRKIYKILEEKLKNNEITIAKLIISYLQGNCNLCLSKVSELIDHEKIGNICLVCSRKFDS